MTKLIFSSKEQVIHHLCGKFRAPGENWVHITRNLTDFELMLVTDGILYIADEKKEYVVHEGEYLLMPPTLFQHGYKNGNCSFYWLHFSIDRDYLLTEEDTLFDPGNIYLPLTGALPSCERVIILMKQLQDSDKRYHNGALNNSLSSAILNEICCQSDIYRKYSEGYQNSQLCSDITDFIRYHSYENLTVAQVADYFSYNPKYLSSLFRKQAGISLKQYILQAKMDIAKAELTDSDHPISQIAYHVGYGDAHNFTNAFKKVTGFSPTEYRRSYGKHSVNFE